MKKILAVLLVAVMIMGTLTACGKKTETNENNGSSESQSNETTGSNDNSATTAPTKNYELTVSGINGSINYTPVYIAREKGFFKDAGIKVNEVMFDNGPVQMEALSSNSWDIGMTGVGGVLSGESDMMQF
jgi:ABC-type nitrate/sulfonate/bicarbonate transport system substrate-binding protein